MKKYILLRKIVRIFHLYGISLLGNRKHVNLYHDLKMEQLFVMGLIFELELACQKDMQDAHAFAVQTPIQIIEKLI
ncbi:acyl carrier protein [Marivirga sp. S37H4]|uniref:Acyl carrier protein n=1 Tax=Marivirga aurantiaca TaxID=2802615 RepID=A0A935C8B0_9BACT|nr:acyl carrier protein [Marivirga aurantiaca]MBK6265511.1 acyl carrier protein [Marivirga aurantiaca]